MALYLLPVPVPGVCKVCGCTDDDGCPQGCYWFEPDLCSACAEVLYTPPPGYVTADQASKACEYIEVVMKREMARRATPATGRSVDKAAPSPRGYS